MVPSIFPGRARPARLAVAAGVLVIVGLPGPGRVAAVSGPADPAAVVETASSAAFLVAQLAGASDPAARFRALPAADQRAVVADLRAASYRMSTVLVRRSETVPSAPQPVVRGTGSASAGAPAAVLASISAPGAGCWSWRWERDAYNLFGSKLWAYFQELDWCDDGAMIIGLPQVLNYGSTWFPFWTWVHAGDHVWGGPGQPSLRSWTQADFSLCLSPNIGCIQNSYPWLDMTAHANGTGTGSVG